MRFLLFTLYAPMASFGEIAVGERRMSWSRPGRSAVLGLVAASLGIERSNETSHRELEDGLYFAVRTDSPGRSFVDYQTAQSPTAPKGKEFATRRSELEAPDLNTVLSKREWLVDPCFTVALWPRPAGMIEVDDIAHALRSPYFTVYLGRKSAPLGLPLKPEVIETDTFSAAFHLRERNEVENYVLELAQSSDTTGELAFDSDAPGYIAESRLERRRDSMVSRERWQFTDRFERVAPSEVIEK